MLDANEHYKQWVKVPGSALTGLNRYPDSSAMALRQKLAECYCGDGIQTENILITSGFIEAIDVLIAAYKPSALILSTPSYDVYKLRADAHRCPCEFIPVDSASQPQADRIIEKAQGMVIIDEAYLEFAGLQNSMQSLAKEYPNVIILRTFSKAWGLAGIRLGYIISNEDNIQHLMPFRNVYSVNVVALTVGLHALDYQGLGFMTEQDMQHILLNEGVFVFRPELADYFDTKIFVDIPLSEMRERAIERDVPRFGFGVLKKYLTRYIPAQTRYLETVRPFDIADIVIDNSDWHNPYIVERGATNVQQATA